MMPSRSRLSVVIASAAFLVSGALDAADPEPFARRIQTMGTWLEIQISQTSRKNALSMSARATAAVQAAEARLSTWTQNSELAAFNRQPVGRWIELSPPLTRDLRNALAWAQWTNGAFDPTVAPLIEAWDLRGAGRHPSAAEIAAAQAQSGLQKLELVDRRIRRLAPGLRLEEGAFGKGAALSDALATLDPDSPACLHLDFGGQIARSARCPEIKITITDPEERHRPLGVVPLSSGAVASSGQSERRIVLNGVTYGHVLDPRSGYPVPPWGSVTVLHPDPLAADCLATALFVMGPRHAIRWLRHHPEIRAVLVEGVGTEARLIEVRTRVRAKPATAVPGFANRKPNITESADSV